MVHSVSCRHSKKTNAKMYFFLFWITGILAGYLFISQINITHFSFIHSVLNYNVSISNYICVHILPFFAIILIGRFSSKPIIAIALFIKAFIYSSTSYMILYAFQEAGWLMRNLLIFSDSLISVYLLYYLVQYADNQQPSHLTALIFISICCLSDYYIISPLIGALNI